MAERLRFRHRNCREGYNLWRHLYGTTYNGYNADTGMLDPSPDRVDGIVLPEGRVPIWVRRDHMRPILEILKSLERNIEADQTVTVVTSKLLDEEELEVVDEWSNNINEDFGGKTIRKKKVRVIPALTKMRGCEDEVVICFHSLGHLNELATRARRLLVMVTTRGTLADELLEVSFEKGGVLEHKREGKCPLGEECPSKDKTELVVVENISTDCDIPSRELRDWWHVREDRLHFFSRLNLCYVLHV